MKTFLFLLSIVFQYWITNNALAQINWDNPTFKEIHSLIKDSSGYELGMGFPEKLKGGSSYKTRKVAILPSSQKLFDYYKVQCSEDGLICNYDCFKKDADWHQQFLVFKKQNLYLSEGIVFLYNDNAGVSNFGFFIYLNKKNWLFVESYPPPDIRIYAINSIMLLDDRLFPIRKLSFCSGKLICKSDLQYKKGLIKETFYEMTSLEYQKRELGQMRLLDIYNLLNFDLNSQQQFFSREFTPYFSIKRPLWSQGSEPLDYCENEVFKRCITRIESEKE